MNRFRSIAKQLGQWQRQQLADTLARLNLGRHRDRLKQHRPAVHSRHMRRYLSRLKPHRLAACAQPSPQRRRLRRAGAPTPVLFAVTVISLTSAIGHRFYNEPQLNVDTIAPQTLRAPQSARVEDVKTTEANREAARTGSSPVLMVDPAVNQEIYQSLQRLIEQGNDWLARGGPFPFVSTSTLSSASQHYLRQVSEPEWQAILAAIGEPTAAARDAAAQLAQSDDASQQLAILELQAARRSGSAEDFDTLTAVIGRARQRYAATQSALAIAADAPLYRAELLSLSDSEWFSTKASIRQALERMLAQGIAPGVPAVMLDSAARAHFADLPQPAQSVAIAMLTAVLKPNLVVDPEQTRLRAEQAAREVAPEIVEIRRGEIIVQAGDTITQSDFVLLDYFGMSRREINAWGLLGFTVLVGGAVVVFVQVERWFHPGLRRRDHVLVLLLTLTAPLVVALKLPTTSLPAIGLLVGSFYGSALGVTVVGALSLLLPIGMQVGQSALIASSIGSLVGAFVAGRRRSREELALLGGAIGLTQGVLYLLINLILTSPTSLVWYSVLSAAALQALLGIAWSIVALGISPYLEHLFDLVTPIRLAELSNPNRPLLKRLAAQAPGTFQHTLFVSTLAEAAARALGCNVELVRAGTLYHDIGKMHDPLGFIENQMGGPNKHDQLNDPWKSAELIKKHVSEGVVMARKCRLPKAVEAFIPEHQGTMFIAYFYHQAQQQAKDNPELVVKDADFRYDGPTPQSRETGIVMLADSCEAALRSLKDATPEEALAMVNRILRARWQDNQLTDSGLTRDDLTRIANIFVRVWQQFNHQRIPYPKAATPPQPTGVS